MQVILETTAVEINQCNNAPSRDVVGIHGNSNIYILLRRPRIDVLSNFRRRHFPGISADNDHDRFDAQGIRFGALFPAVETDELL